MFIIFNIVAYTAYVLAVLSFSLQGSMAKQTDASIKSFYQVVCAINGLCFLLLTALLLNYGNRLEKVVAAIKAKTEIMQMRQHNEMVNFKHLED
jgi:hypothetical protein